MFKDKKEGTTHSYNDNCGMPEHNDPMKKTIQEQIEETHLKLLDTYEQPEEFKRVLEEAIATAEKWGAERVIRRLYVTIGAVEMGMINKEQGYSDLVSQLQVLNPTKL